MRFSLRTLTVVSLWLGLAAAARAESETLAERTLRDIVGRQQAIFARAEAEKDHVDEAWLRGELQSVINSYDILIQKAPDFAPACAAYGLLLGKVGMTKEAAAMLIKANQLDGEIALVKNEMARLLAEDGKVAEALPWLTAATTLEPNEPLYHYHLGKLLTEGRDDIIATGQFTRATLDKAMLAAFQRAAQLAPDNFAYTYRAAEAYYDLAEPQWEEALAAWSALEQKAKPGVEQQTIRLHAANVQIKLGRRDQARALLLTVTEPALQKQKQTLLDELAKPTTK
jgi:tetratricopeptide (TPR) repeat protein